MIGPFVIGVDLAPFNAAFDHLAAIAEQDPQAVEAFLAAFPIEQLCDCASPPGEAVLIVRPSQILNNFLGSFDLKGKP
jgi:hypothetical protein